MSIYKTSCPSCGQRDVRDPDGQGPIFDHNGPDGRECSVSDIDWNGAMALHPVAPVERRSYVSKERFEAAERECVQLRADNDRLREIHHGDPHMLGAVLGYELREAEEAGEVAQLRAERDQALALLRRLRDEPLQTSATPYADGINDALRTMRRLITASGLLDDEGQQR